MALVFVDVEAVGLSPKKGVMTEFGAVAYDPNGKHHKKTFHGRLFEGYPDPANPAVPIAGARVAETVDVAIEFIKWLDEVSPGQATLVSDNPAYDFMWIAGFFDEVDFDNPFGHSGRRIADFWAGLNNKWSDTQSWKRFRETEHDHNPVNDAMGNVEAYEKIMQIVKERQTKRIPLTREFGGRLEDCVGYAEVSEDFKKEFEDRLVSNGTGSGENWVFSPAYISDFPDENGVIHTAELIELSLIPANRAYRGNK